MNRNTEGMVVKVLISRRFMRPSATTLRTQSNPPSGGQAQSGGLGVVGSNPAAPTKETKGIRVISLYP